MKDIYCIVGGTFVVSGIIMAIMKTDTGIFEDFNRLLTKSQQEIYKQIIRERSMIYISGMLLGLFLGMYYLWKNPNDTYRFCKFLVIVYGVKLGFYYLFPKSPLMLYSLTTQKQVSAWADIYTEMKRRWITSLLLGFIGYVSLSMALLKK